MATRPEEENPPEIFYDETEARKYTTSSRIVEVQERLSQRALELLALPEDGVPRLLLDIGCGSGLSGEALSRAGHMWVGMDISPAMLDVAREREVEGDVLLSDIGEGVPMRNAVFDGAVSISALQWLCNADKSHHDPRQRLRRFFQTLYRCLSRGARAALQFYPNGPKQLEMISSAAMKAGFSGGVVVDYPHSTRAKKFFLCLMVGPASVAQALPKAKGTDPMQLGSDDEEQSDDEGGSSSGEEGGPRGEVGYTARERPRKRGKGAGGRVKGKSWVLKKKEQRRHRGYTVPQDTKYTGRKRKARF